MTHLFRLFAKFTFHVCFSEPKVKMDVDAPAKKPRLESPDAYVPVQESSSNGDGTSNYSLIFSLKERKGELFKSLQPFQVKFVLTKASILAF